MRRLMSCAPAIIVTAFEAVAISKKRLEDPSGIEL